LGQNDMMAYLTMMAIRLVELHRVLKPEGSIYLHCDPTASHYLKSVMDAIFGGRNFLNEIIWHYRKWPTGKYSFQRNHDVILFYSRTGNRNRTFNQIYMDRAASTLKRFGTARIVSGHTDDGRRVPSETAEEESLGVRQDDVWDIGRVPPIKQLFPTQKPDPLLDRVIEASSNEGDLVLDPFCGCGTTICAAERLHRRWQGIDITHLAIALIKNRLQDTFKQELSQYRVIGEPRDLTSAQFLAMQNRHQFQYWALSLVEARPAPEARKKGADQGIDGVIRFHDDDSGSPKRVILQVKSGHVSVRDVRELKGVMERDEAEMGALITLEEPTGPMRAEAVAAGFYEPPALLPPVPRLQLLTVRELLDERRIDYPRVAPATFKRADRQHKARPKGNGNKD
ncbi:MAG: restriction endonuclease, partial [Armatimonadetes bacterium]|nr:restriction endonuclease [Armatimonadota bacterium]